MSIESMQDAFIANGQRFDAYAWPGGYTVIYITGWNDILCADCATRIMAEFRNVTLLDALGFDDVPMGPINGEIPADCGPYWEGPTVECAECGAPIESAYGDPDTQDSED